MKGVILVILVTVIIAKIITSFSGFLIWESWLSHALQTLLSRHGLNTLPQTHVHADAQPFCKVCARIIDKDFAIKKSLREHT